MRLLLDTHIVLWSLSGSRRLNRPVRQAILTASEVFVSAASIWEAAIKASLGRLTVDADLPSSVSRAGFTMLPVTFAHAHAVGDLPLHHRDPFDRMLVAQALAERLTLVTADDELGAYDVPLLST